MQPKYISICTCKCACTYEHTPHTHSSSIFHNSIKIKTNQRFIISELEHRIDVYLYIEILQNNGTGQASAIHS